jgi:hypothetical protein
MKFRFVFWDVLHGSTSQKKNLKIHKVCFELPLDGQEADGGSTRLWYVGLLHRDYTALFPESCHLPQALIRPISLP